MKNFNRFVLCLISLCCSFITQAQTISWSVKPQWESVEMLGENLVRVSILGKQGVINLSGTRVIPCSFSNITEISNRRFLVLDPDNKILSLWDEDGNQIQFNGDYFVDAAWPFYSDGLLAVRDGKGLWGFLNLSGVLAVPCRFAAAFPFVFGQAAVCYKDGYWAHIGTDGKPVLLKSQRLRSKKISFASTFTQIGDRQLSLVCIEDYMYLIDPSGEVVPTSIIGKDGQPLYGAGIGPRIIAGSYMIHFNDVGEIESIKKGEVVHSFVGKSRPKETPFPDVDEIAVSDNNSFTVGDLIIAPHFDKIIPLSTSTVLTEENMKWGLITVNRLANAPMINKSRETDQLVLEHGSSVIGSFYVSSPAPKTEVYVDKDGKTILLDINDNTQYSFDVPLVYEDGKLFARIGLMMDGIKLMPQDFAITPSGYDEAFSVNCPASVTVPDSGKVSFRMTVKNTSSKQNTGLFDIRVNGGIVRRSISLDCGESIVVPISISVNLGEEDKVVKRINIRITESGCPAVNMVKTITYVRQLKED